MVFHLLLGTKRGTGVNCITVAQEANWIPAQGKAPYAMFRLYGPKDTFYDKSFKLPDVELVK